MDVDSPPEHESVAVEILGTPLRVRVPYGEAEDVYRAAQLVRERFEQVRKPADPPDRALIRAALEIAYEALTSQRTLERTLRRLLRHLDDDLSA